jgi:hypothetical protein
MKAAIAMPGKLSIKLLIIGLFVAGLVAFFVLDAAQYLNIETLRQRRDDLLAFTSDNLALMIAAYMGLYILMAASVGAGSGRADAGRWRLVRRAGRLRSQCRFASTIGATLVFLAARFLFRDAIQQRFGKRLKAINEGVERDGAFYLLALRLVPAVPVLGDQPGHGAHPDSHLDLLLGQPAWHAPGHDRVRQCRHSAGAHRFSMGDILSPQLIGAFVLLGLLPLLLRWILRFLEAPQESTADHRKPAQEV